jgi:hypothetical protein
MYNNFGEGQYVPGIPLPSASWGIWLIYPWFMPALFIIAGISTRYSLQKRSIMQYISERFLRIGLPLLAGIVLLNPIMSYIADTTNNGYNGGYFEHYSIFFTKLTDFSGYDGGFALSHLWFLLYLLIISFAALPVYLLFKKYPKLIEWDHYPILLIIAFGVLQGIAANFLNIGNKSFAQYFVLFLIGVFVLSHDKIQEKLEKYRWWFILSTLILGIGYAFAIKLKWSDLIIDIFYFYYGYIMVLGFLGIGRKYLNFQNKTMIYASQCSMLYYIFHYPILVGVSFILMPHINMVPVQMVVFIIISFLFTLVTAEIIKRIPFVRTLFGIKAYKPHKFIK